MSASEREFEPLSFPHRAAGREEKITPEFVAAIEKLAGSIALLAETLSHSERKAASGDFSLPGI